MQILDQKPVKSFYKHIESNFDLFYEVILMSWQFLYYKNVYNWWKVFT